jgi:SAM-dependent methyltransferase
LGPACPICDGRTVPSARLGRLGYRECSRCGFVFRPDVDEAATREVYEGGAYAEAHELYADPARIDGLRRDARVRLRWLAPHAASGRLLDVGAAGGAFVAEAVGAGYDARGLEPTPAFAGFARERLGVDVMDGTIESAALPAASLDVVTLWHVLEHLPDPRDAVDRLRDALVPGGVLALEVPNFGGALAQRDGASWGSLQPDVHVNQFTPGALAALLTRVRLEVVELGTVPITPYLPKARRLDPRHIAARLKAAGELRSVRTAHPTGHELLRAVARRPAA